MDNIRLVTALVNIDREKMDGRVWEDYLKWFEVTLKVNCAMTVYVTDDLIELVQRVRGERPTTIVTINSDDDIPYYMYYDQIETILNDDDYKSKIKDNKRIECNHPFYTVIQYSKFVWMMDALQRDDSDYIFWIDAGASRFFEDYDLDQMYPSAAALNNLYEMGNKFLVQVNTEYYSELVDNNIEYFNSIEYQWDNRSFVLGSMFGGAKDAVYDTANKVHVYFEESINQGLVNNEQIALGYLIKRFPDLFEHYYRTNGRHLDLFFELG
jgi:hypothetical protein